MHLPVLFDEVCDPKFLYYSYNSWYKLTGD